MLFLSFTIGLWVWIFSQFGNNGLESSHNKISEYDSVDACISRGIAYFKEVGAYPILTTTGENAEQVAKERCNRTTTAFQ